MNYIAIVLFNMGDNSFDGQHVTINMGINNPNNDINTHVYPIVALVDGMATMDHVMVTANHQTVATDYRKSRILNSEIPSA